MPTMSVSNHLGEEEAGRHDTLGGGVVGPIVAIASHASVGAFAYAFFLGFADAGRGLLDALRLDPRLQEVLASPWSCFCWSTWRSLPP
jgi:hypothetical protein